MDHDAAVPVSPAPLDRPDLRPPDGGPPPIPYPSPAPDHADRVLLEGPHSRLKELMLLGRAMRDLFRGFRALHFVGPCVTVFGSARLGPTSPYYEIARAVGGRLSDMGFTVMTGGGPGLMEAANLGAREHGGLSVGCNIALPHEQDPNPYLDRWVTCHHFFTRKVLLFKYSYAFVVMPGGLGTLDEMAEALTLIQTGKIEEFPVVLIGTKYWEPFSRLLSEMVQQGSVSDTDLRLFKLTDDLDVAMDHIERHAVTQFGLKRVMKPAWWLGEQAVTTSAGSRPPSVPASVRPRSSDSP